MSFDSDSGYVHLTRDGWVRQDAEPFPDGRIETWRYSMRQSYPTQPEYHDFWLEWVDESVPVSERDHIREQVGNPMESRRREVVVRMHFPDNGKPGA